ATVEYIVAKHGCCPAYINPVRAKLSVQVHHVDTSFYRKYYGSSDNNSAGGSGGGGGGGGGGEPYALTPAVLDHFPTWHPGLDDPGRQATTDGAGPQP
ncbi:MAG: hypothetical protein ACYCUF_00460, partial [Acidimicrobiales bacterium]